MRRKPTAIIDIGSNSVRLVVYAGPRRVPYILFNEKVMAGLGAGLAETGAIRSDAADRALGALRRFKLLIDRLGGARTKVVATAAVRDAGNGPDFVARVKDLGLPCKVLAAEEEATLAGLGVVSAIPAANGIVGDLGGGSLELISVNKGCTSLPHSVPVGVLRLTEDSRSAQKELRRSIGVSSLPDLGHGRSFYMVGGSWRALAKLDMIATNHPLPIIPQYRIEPGRVAYLGKLARSAGPEAEKLIGRARLATLPAAAMFLEVIVEELRPSELIASSFGIREGLLYSTLSPDERRRDPLIEAVRELSSAEAGSKGHGDALHAWLQEAFEDAPELRRLRLAACLLMDAARRTASPFQADRTVEMALHGAWMGVDAADRVMMAQALSTSFGRNSLPNAGLAQLAEPCALKRAKQWGLAMRAGERLSAGIPAVLRRTKLTVAGPKLELRVPPTDQDLVNETVLRRVVKLANSLELQAEIALT